MGKKRRMLVAALVLAALGGLAWVLFFRAEPEPVYQGKSLSAWLSLNIDDPTSAEVVSNAVCRIGTNGIPSLLRMLRARDSILKRKLVDLAQIWHLMGYVAMDKGVAKAEWAFGILGEEARDAVPALIEMLEQSSSPESRFCAIQALGRIGPAAKAAVPLLVNVVLATNAPGQKATLFGTVWPVRREAIAALGFIHARPDLVVPVLISALGDPRWDNRFIAAFALGSFGADAKPAVPSLFKLLADEDTEVRENAASAIRKIDPEAAALRKAELDAVLPPENR
jgi:hypothetical protein